MAKLSGQVDHGIIEGRPEGDQVTLERNVCRIHRSVGLYVHRHGPENRSLNLYIGFYAFKILPVHRTGQAGILHEWGNKREIVASHPLLMREIHMSELASVGSVLENQLPIGNQLGYLKRSFI